MLEISKSRLAAAGWLLFAAPAFAQVQFEPMDKRNLPTDNASTRALETCDLNGDGIDDVVLVGTHNRIYFSDGLGVFTDVTGRNPALLVNGTTAVASGDVDGDGDIDLVLGTAGRNRLYLNDGSGTLSDVTATNMPTHTDPTLAAAACDLDGDGDIDLIFGSRSTSAAQLNRIYLNDGFGVFRDARAAIGAWATGIACFDVDNDGDTDLVFARGNDGIPLGLSDLLFLNDGAGNFTAAPAGQMPADTRFTKGVACGDVDGDGDIDLLFANGDSPTSPGKRNPLYLNDGFGRFTDVTATRIPAHAGDTAAVQLADIDGDGDLDAIVGNGSEYTTAARQNRVYLNDGAGTFTDATAARLPSDPHNTQALACHDVDGDGDLDLIFGHGERSTIVTSGPPDRLLLNDGSGHFIDSSPTRLPVDIDRTWVITPCDVDGDEDLDLVCGNGFTVLGHANRLYLNDGRGNFTDGTATRMPVFGETTRSIASSDVDGDGDLDLIFGNGESFSLPSQNRLYLNDGTGTFTDATASRMPPNGDASYGVVCPDLNGDGAPDIVFANYGQSTIYLNDGSGTFADATVVGVMFGFIQAVAHLDVDGDGDQDLVFGTRTGRDELYLNDGTGSFTDATSQRMPSIVENTQAVLSCDVDGDGDLDLVFATAEQNRLFLNDGSGFFSDATATHLPVSGIWSDDVVAGDVDADGDLDLVFSNGRTTLYLNDGIGRFTDVSSVRMSNRRGAAVSLAIGDWDTDGDLDLATAANGQNRLEFNLLRQLDVPYLARLGAEYRLDAHARYGPSRLTEIVLPYLSNTPARIPVPPYGVLGVDPLALIALPQLTIQQPAGIASYSVMIPDNPIFEGFPLYAQALWIPLPGDGGLTNTTGDRVAR